MKHSLFSTKVVQGSQDAEVAEIRFRTPPLDHLFAASPESRVAFDLFGEDHRRSSWTGLLGAVGFVGGLIVGATGDEEWAAGLSIGGTVFSLVSGVFRTKANEHLSVAVRAYNGTLGGTGRPVR